MISREYVLSVLGEHKPDLLMMVHMKDELELLPQRPVYLVRYQQHLNALLKSRIDRDAVYV